MSEEPPKGPTAAETAGIARRQARLAAVQALYQMDLAATDLNEVVAQFELHRFTEASEEIGHGEVEQAFFEDLIKGVVARQREIDPLVDKQLATGWRLQRLDSILRAILRAGVFELLERSDVPARVTINEYINIAKAFFEADEPKVVNGVLDRIAHKVRAKEFEPPSEGG